MHKQAHTGRHTRAGTHEQACTAGKAQMPYTAHAAAHTSEESWPVSFLTSSTICSVESETTTWALHMERCVNVRASSTRHGTHRIGSVFHHFVPILLRTEIVCANTTLGANTTSASTPCVLAVPICSCEMENVRVALLLSGLPTLALRKTWQVENTLATPAWMCSMHTCAACALHSRVLTCVPCMCASMNKRFCVNTISGQTAVTCHSSCQRSFWHPSQQRRGSTP